MRHMQLDIHNVLFMFSFFSVRISVLFQELGTDSFSQLLNVQVKICKDVSQATECGKLACFFQVTELQVFFRLLRNFKKTKLLV